MFTSAREPRGTGGAGWALRCSKRKQLVGLAGLTDRSGSCRCQLYTICTCKHVHTCKRAQAGLGRGPGHCHGCAHQMCLAATTITTGVQAYGALYQLRCVCVCVCVRERERERVDKGGREIRTVNMWLDRGEETNCRFVPPRCPQSCCTSRVA